MRLKVCLIIAFLALVPQAGYAQNVNYKFSRLDLTNGLFDNHINCIFKDAKGFMWFGSTSGLNRYDGYTFKIFKHDPNNPNSLGENQVLRINEGPENNLWIFTHSGICVYNLVTEKFTNDLSALLARLHIQSKKITLVKKDKEGCFWFLTNSGGVYCYNSQKNTTSFFSTSQNSKIILHSNNVVNILPVSNYAWLIYSDGIIDKLDLNSEKIAQRFDGLAKENNFKPQSYILTQDNTDNLWIYANECPLGVYLYHPKNNTLIHFSKDLAKNKLNSNVINSIVQADDNKIWIGTDHGGVNVVDPQTFNITYLLHKEDDPKSLSENSVNLYKDDSGIIWAGTFKQGISYYHSGILQFPLYKHFITDKNSLPFEDVDCFAEDSKGNLWIGTNGGGLLFYNRITNTYKQFKHDPLNSNSLSNDIIINLCIDRNQKLWIGTYFGGLDSFDGNVFSHHRHSDKNPGSITDDRIYSILEDSKGIIWAGTYTGGLNIYNPISNTFSHPQYPSLSQYTSIIYQDSKENIWIGRDKGVDEILKTSKKVKHFFNDPNKFNSLVSNDVNTIVEDSRGLMWIGTKDGLSILNPQNDEFILLKDGVKLPSNEILNILEDKAGTLWISTSKGLANVRIIKNGKGYKFQTNNFNELDGLQGRGFNLNASLRLKNGLLIFGGSHGFNMFNPQQINSFKHKIHLVFTDFKLFNKSVAVGDSIKGKVILSKSISETHKITLRHSENVFSIAFAVCDYFNPDKIKYEYKLEGFDKGWIASPVTDRTATYTNLDGGDYNLKVRAKNANNISDTDLITLEINVLPPFWKSPSAYLLYLIGASLVLFGLRHRGILKLKRQFQIEQVKIETERKISTEREESMRMHQLDLMKIKFFTNLSHDFRTPLSLILSPIEHLLKTTEQPDQQHHLHMIKRNGKRLLNMVNQLLDFRKMEYKELKIYLKKGDIIQFIKDVYSSFSDVAHQNNIQYIFESEQDSFLTHFDHEKIERILFNLLSNAFKFTAPGGNVSVLLNIDKAGILTNGEEEVLVIKVIDTGIGIPPENLEKIFDCYFQDDLPAGLQNQGNGIGLSITSEFIKIHGGSIFIESEPGYGTCFTIKIPVGELNEKVVLDNSKQLQSNYKASQDIKVELGSAKKTTILLIEDNDDLRFYLKDNLKQTFHVIEAVNGKDGWQKALALHPKLIVSDIDMPEMNGIELCKKIKEDDRTAQIPFILLTALIGEKDQLSGLDSGANDYMIKPFNFEILLSKINNLLKMQQTLKKTYQRQVEINPTEIIVISEDDLFVKNALAYIESNIANPNFSVEELSRHLNLSRVSLYKKLLTLTGKTPIDFIRTIRLKMAVQLLQKSKLSIANIGYEVGFNNAAYFAKVFREEYGILPSEYLAEMRKKEKEEINSI